MGEVYKLYCDNCGYELEATLGVGFLFPRVYKETLDEARDGKLGDKIQTFLREHPDGAIDCSLVERRMRMHSLKCPNCRSKLNEGLDVIMWD